MRLERKKCSRPRIVVCVQSSQTSRDQLVPLQSFRYKRKLVIIKKDRTNISALALLSFVFYPLFVETWHFGKLPNLVLWHVDGNTRTCYISIAYFEHFDAQGISPHKASNFHHRKAYVIPPVLRWEFPWTERNIKSDIVRDNSCPLIESKNWFTMTKFSLPLQVIKNYFPI